MARRRKRTVPRTFVVIVQDKSGSMGNKTQATISGFNEYKNTLRQDAKGEVLLTLTQFDTRVHRVHSAVPIDDVPDLNSGSYVPGGMTSLYDAVGQAVRDTERAARQSDRVLVVIMTDGGENSSHEWRHDGILDLFASKRKAEWEFVFLGAGEEAWAAGQSLGFDYDHSINYNLRGASHRKAFQAVASTTSAYTQGVTVAKSLGANSFKHELEHEAGSAGPSSPGWVVQNTGGSGTTSTTGANTVFIDLTPEAQSIFKTEDDDPEATPSKT